MKLLFASYHYFRFKFERTHNDSFPIIGIFDMDFMCLFLTSFTLKEAFISGSSKHGKAFLASVASICVVAIYL